MISADAFQRWVAAQKTPRIEVIAGLHAAGLQPGRLDGPEVRPGEPVRASGYAEDRSLYTQPLFAPEGEEPRTVHLGLDIFAPMGADVFAPLEGRVHSFRINDNPGDYGPTIILEHAAGGEKFNTLYGHLSRDSLKGLKRGDAFMGIPSHMGGPYGNAYAPWESFTFFWTRKFKIVTMVRSGRGGWTDDRKGEGSRGAHVD